MPPISSILDLALNRRESWVWLLGIGLMLRVMLWMVIGDLPLVGDSLYYMQDAEQLLQGNLKSTYWPPGLPLYEAGWMLLFGKGVLSMRLSMLPWFILLGRSTYSFVLQVHSRPAANLALLGLCFYPEFIHHSIEPLSHLPTAACLMYALTVAVKFSMQERVKLFRLGVVLGYMALVRPTSVVFFVIIPLWMFLERRSLMRSLWVAFWAVAVMGSWVYVQSAENGRFIPVNEANTRNFFLGNNPWTPHYKTWYLGSHWEGEPEIPEGYRAQLKEIQSLPPEQQSEAYLTEAWKHVRSEPGLFAERTAARMRTFWAFDTFTGARMVKHHGLNRLGYAVIAFNFVFFSGVLFFAVCALLRVWKAELQRNLVLMLGLILLAYCAPYWMAFSHPTYHLPILPILLALAAVPLSKKLMPLGSPIALFPKGKIGMMVVVFIVVAAIQVEWVVRMLG